LGFDWPFGFLGGLRPRDFGIHYSGKNPASLLLRAFHGFRRRVPKLTIGSVTKQPATAWPVRRNAAHRWQLTGKPRHQYQYDPFHQAWSGRL